MHGQARAVLIFGLAVACLTAVAVVLSNPSTTELPYGAHQLKDGGLPWLEIRTIEEQSD
jgi:hypothetical protein